MKGKPADFFLNQVKLNSGSNFSSSVIQDKLMWLGTSDERITNVLDTNYDNKNRTISIGGLIFF